MLIKRVVQIRIQLYFQIDFVGLVVHNQRKLVIHLLYCQIGVPSDQVHWKTLVQFEETPTCADYHWFLLLQRKEHFCMRFVQFSMVANQRVWLNYTIQTEIVFYIISIIRILKDLLVFLWNWAFHLFLRSPFVNLLLYFLVLLLIEGCQS